MPLTLVEVCSRFSADDRCRELLERLRFPEGPRCLRCSDIEVTRLSDKLLFCRKCEYQFSVTAGTILHDTHLPLLKWFAAVYLLCESRKGMSANQMKRMLGTTYKTAWYLCHRIRAAMKEAERLPQHLAAYLNEIEFRFNRRNTDDLFEQTLRYMVTTDPLKYVDLIK